MNDELGSNQKEVGVIQATYYSNISLEELRTTMRNLYGVPTDTGTKQLPSAVVQLYRQARLLITLSPYFLMFTASSCIIYRVTGGFNSLGHKECISMLNLNKITI
jgi:hypothetical protein